MTRTLIVTLAKDLSNSPPFDGKNIPAEKTSEEMALFFEANRDEIAFAKNILKDAPPGTKLRHHFRDKSLRYTEKDAETGTEKSLILQHTYTKIGPDMIAVQTERGDINIVGSGSFGEVKRGYTLPNESNAPPHCRSEKVF